MISFLVPNPETFKFLKKRLWHRCFSVNFTKFLKNIFSIEHMDDCFCNFKYSSMIIFTIRLPWNNIVQPICRAENNVQNWHKNSTYFIKSMYRALLILFGSCWHWRWFWQSNFFIKDVLRVQVKFAQFEGIFRCLFLWYFLQLQRQGIKIMC